MAVPVTVPRLGLAAGEGLIAEWYKLDGASVDAGDLMYRIETDFASIDVEADESGVIRHAPGAEGVPTEGDVIAYLLAPDEAPPGQDQPPEPQAQTRSSRAAASRAGTPSPKAPRARGRSKVYPLKEVLEVAAVPPVEPEPPVPEGLPWDPFPATEQVPEEVFEAPKPLLLFPRIVNQLKEEAAVEAEEDDTAPEQPEAPPESETREHFGWELVPGENDFNPDWLLERNEGKEPAQAKADRFQASNIRNLALGRSAEPEPESETEPEPEAVPEPEPESGPEPEPESGPELEPPALEAEPDEQLPSELPAAFPIQAAVSAELELPVVAPDSSRGAGRSVASGQLLFARITMDVTEAGKMREQLTREWMGSNLRPTDEDIVVRAIARALHEGTAFRRHTDVVGVRSLTGSSRNVYVLAAAASRPFRDAVASLAALRATPGTEMAGICTVTNYGAFGLDDAMSPLAEGQALAFGMGSVRLVPIFRGDRPVRASVLTLTLSYDPEEIPDGAAARLLSRVCELVEAPYALLAH